MKIIYLVQVAVFSLQCTQAHAIRFPVGKPVQKVLFYWFIITCNSMRIDEIQPSLSIFNLGRLLLQPVFFLVKINIIFNYLKKGELNNKVATLVIQFVFKIGCLN